jgi:hypothetical protein
MAAPAALGAVLIGPAARNPAVRLMFRFYGTRDVVLGLGTVRSAARGGEVGAWLGAGIASDVLDTAIQLAEWKDVPANKRVPGLLAALGGAGVGAALLARR